ncbi:MAG: hypothetical protein AAGC81_16630 [Pseudomonadota bacterium]
MSILKSDMAEPNYNLARRMDKMRALVDGMFPDLQFKRFSKRVFYCDAGVLETPQRVSVRSGARISLLPIGNGQEILNLVHVYAQRHCAPE